MTEVRVDPRVERTRRALFAALIELIQERRWDKIRVQDVLDRTGISRSAFYAHFDNKYDLLVGQMPTLKLQIIRGEDGGPDMSQLFEHVDEVSSVLLPLLTQPVLGEISDTFHRLLIEAWTDYLNPDGAQSGADPSTEVLAELLAGAVGAVVRSYTKDRNRIPPQEMADLVEPHLRGLLGVGP